MIACSTCNNPAAGVIRNKDDGKHKLSCDHCAPPLSDMWPLENVHKLLDMKDRTMAGMTEMVTGARQEAAYLRPLVPKRYFTVDDGGTDYTIVAADLDHAKCLLRTSGVEFTTEDGDSAPIDDPRFADLRWIELSPEFAAKARVATGDSGAPPVIPLSECKVGDWFCSEY